MNGYSLRYKESAASELERLPATITTRIIHAIDRLPHNPRPHGSVKLKGSLDTYRIRVGQYRVIYTIDDPARTVRITRVRHRSDVYD